MGAHVCPLPSRPLRALGTHTALGAHSSSSLRLGCLGPSLPHWLGPHFLRDLAELPPSQRGLARLTAASESPLALTLTTAVSVPAFLLVAAFASYNILITYQGRDCVHCPISQKHGATGAGCRVRFAIVVPQGTRAVANTWRALREPSREEGANTKPAVCRVLCKHPLAGPVPSWCRYL